MNRHSFARTVVLSLMIGVSSAIAQALEQPPASSAEAPKLRLDAAHEKTIAAATRAYDASIAAADALCRQDSGLQTRTRTAADAAQKALDAAAQAEADEVTDVAQARYALIGATFAMNGSHPQEEMERLKSDADTKMQSYTTLKDAKVKSIIDAALQSVAGPTKVGGCPAPAAPQQRAAQPNPIPPLPATPQRASAMLRGFSDSVFKATLAQPGLRGRVETLMGLEGCDWTVNGNVASRASTRNAARYLNRMNDEDLRATLSDGVMLDRIDAAFGRGSCYVSGPENNPVTAFPVPNNNRNQDGGPYPYGYPDDYNRRNPNIPGIPYGRGAPYGGYGTRFPY